MAYTTINKSSLHFTPKLWTGTGAENAITGVGFQPDWVWIKNRDAAENHKLYDAVRGANKVIYSNLTNAEATVTQDVKSFDSDGYTLGTESAVNASGQDIVGWNWKMNGAGSSNSDGSVTSTVSVNSTAKMSIVKFAGTGANATVGHGLGVAPNVILIKNMDASQNWFVFHKGMYDTDSSAYINLNTTDGKSQSNNVFNGTAPTSSVFTIGVTFSNGQNLIAYCFADLTGFFNSGIYTGNGNANGSFMYTGFKPEFIIMKQYGANGQGWFMKTNSLNARVGNPNDYFLSAHTTNAENTSTSFQIDMVSNGFKLRNTDGICNTNGSSYLYMAWASAPLVGSNNIPATAR